MTTDATISPSARAFEAATALRLLNHATLRPSAGEGWERAEDVYTVVAGLTETATQAPQSIDQVRSLLAHLAGSGGIRSEGGQAQNHVRRAQDSLRDAQYLAEKAAVALDRAQMELGSLRTAE